MLPLEVANAHVAQRLALMRAAAEVAAQRWAALDQARIAESWLRALPELSMVVTGAQLAAAKAADPYVTSILESQGIDAASAAAIDPARFAGIASDGRNLGSLLYQPVIATLSALKTGAPLQRALATGAAGLNMMVRTQVADAGRVADQASLVARPHVDGYVRVVVGATCSRCVVLAGRWYRWSEGFDRHPNCDCQNLAAQQASAAKLVQDPKVIYDSLTPAERRAAGWSDADQDAIAAGADLNQVTNARRGAFTAGGEKLTTTGTPRHALFGGYEIDAERGTFTPRPKGSAPKESRLMPETIYKQAKGDRHEALRLLRENGYIRPDVVDGRFVLSPMRRTTARFGDVIGRDAADAAMRRQEIRTELERVVNGEYAGLRVRLTAIITDAGRTSFEADILDAAGNLVGQTERHLYRAGGVDTPERLYVYHASLDLRSGVQGQGFAGEFAQHMESWYRSSGVEHIKLLANVDVGGYAWARQGYDWVNARAANDVADRMRNIMDRLGHQFTAAELAEGRAMLARLNGEFGSPGYPTPYELSALGRQPGQGRDDSWLGKRVLLGSSWQAVKWLT